MTNAGLHIRMYLMPLGLMSNAGNNTDAQHSQEYYAVLDCASYMGSDGERYKAAILLTSLGGDQYARVHPEAIFSLPSSVLSNPQQGDGYQYIYVKQLPRYGLPDIVLDPTIFEAGALPTLQALIKLLEVYPGENWNESTFTLKPATAHENAVLGAFRYALACHDDGRGDSADTLDAFAHRNEWLVDIFVGLAAGHEGRQMFWCAQQQADRVQTLASSAADFDSSKLLRKMRTTPQDQHPLLHVLAKVQTIRVHNRIKIQLSLSEIHETYSVDVPVSIEPRTPGIAEIDSVMRPSTPTIRPTMASLPEAEPFVMDDSWNIGLGFSLAESGQAKLQARIRVPTNPTTARSDGDFPLHQIIITLMRRPVRIQLEPDWALERGESELHFQRYFSLLLARACVRNDADAAAELLRSPLSKGYAMVEVQTCLQKKEHEETPPWHTAFRKFRPIHWATALGHREVLRTLLSNGADVFSTTGIRMSAADLATIMGRMDLLQDLAEAMPKDQPHQVLQADTEPNWWDRTDAREPIPHLAASYVTSAAVRWILPRCMQWETSTDPADYRYYSTESWLKRFTVSASTTSHGTIRYTNAIYNTLSETPLHRAAANGNLNAVEAILSRAPKNEIHLGDRNGRTPLWHAAAAGACDVVRLLLRHVPNPNKPDTKGWTPLHAACRGGHARVVEILFEAGVGSPEREVDIRQPPISAFHLAVLSGNAATLRIFLDRGQDPNVPLICSGRHFVPLHIAVCNGWLDCVRLLCEAGCDMGTAMHESAGTLIVDGQGSGTVALHGAYGHAFRSLSGLALDYGHIAVYEYIQSRNMVETTKTAREDVATTGDVVRATREVDSQP
jgi:ankyrin repeat protein